MLFRSGPDGAEFRVSRLRRLVLRFAIAIPNITVIETDAIGAFRMLVKKQRGGVDLCVF